MLESPILILNNIFVSKIFKKLTFLTFFSKAGSSSLVFFFGVAADLFLARYSSFASLYFSLSISALA
jgi:hypothetical protein